MSEESKVIEQESMDATKAQAFLKADQEQRAKAFADYIETGKAKFNCELAGLPQITADGRIAVLVHIMPK